MPAKLYSPVIMDPVWGYEAINVEAQQSDPSSLLSWMRNMIALRKLFRVFGRGTLSSSIPRTARCWPTCASMETRECCAWPTFRVSRSRWSWTWPRSWNDAGGDAGLRRVPQDSQRTLSLDPGPLRLSLAGIATLARAVPSLAEAGEPELQISGVTDWMSILEGNGRRELEESVLQGYVSRQRWFGGKSRPMTGVRIEDWAVFNQGVSALVLIEVQYAEGQCDTYLITLGLLFGRGADALREESPNAVIEQ